ncbi:unnamed protein product [Caretta caretta]
MNQQVPALIDTNVMKYLTEDCKKEWLSGFMMISLPDEWAETYMYIFFSQKLHQEVEDQREKTQAKETPQDERAIGFEVNLRVIPIKSTAEIAKPSP